MKVCHFSTNHNAFDTRILWKQCVSLAKAGHEVTFVSQFKEENRCDEVTLVRFPTLKPRLLRVLLGPWLMLWTVWRCKADAYHFHDPELLPAGLLLRWISGKPVIYDVHEDNVTVIRERPYIPGFLRKLIEKVYLFLEARARKHLQLVLAERYYARRIPEGVTVLNYPILPDAYEPGAVSGEQERVINDSAPHWVVYTGSVREDRGALNHARLVSIFNDIGVLSAGICPEALAGRMSGIAGDDKRLLMEGVGTAKVPRKRLDELTGNHRWLAGLALFPKTDHFKEKELTKFFEYMRDGIPILCSDMPAWKEFVEENGVGIAVDPENDAAIRAALERLIASPEECIEMGRRGQQLVFERYRWDREAEKLIDLYSKFATGA